MEEIVEIIDEIEDEDFEVDLPRKRGPTIFRLRTDHFEKWEELDFFDRFRLHKRTANIIIEMIQNRISSVTDKNRALSPAVKVLTTLRFFASGMFLINLAELGGIHYSTASKVVKEVSIALAELCPQVIKMPVDHEEIQKVSSGFYEKARFPKCIGSLDCTHVKIQSPGGDNAELYRNRKGFFSMNVQGICDSSLCIQNIVARWPGSTHDSHIFNSSKVKKDFERNVYGNHLLVGDSGYACSNYLITPIEEVNTPEEKLFQEAQVRTRNPIERCFGVLKRRFPALALGIRLKIDRVESIIVSCAVLHNICVQEREDVPEVTEEAMNAIEALEAVAFHQLPPRRTQNRRLTVRDRNLITRNNLISGYFKSLL